MTNIFQNDIQICLDFVLLRKLLIDSFGENGGEFSSYYDARILYNHREPRYINFMIFYNHSEYLFEKLLKLKDEGVNILSGIASRPPPRAGEYPDKLDFSRSNILNIEESHHWEHNKKPLILTLDNLNIFLNSRFAGDGNFQLTENVYQHIYEYYNYGGLGDYTPSDKFIDSDNNRDISFGEIQLNLSFRHKYGDSNKFSLTINRDAYLNITDSSDSLTNIQILELAEILCTLMSFYWQKTIDFFIASIRVNNEENYRTHEVYKYSNHHIDESSEFSLKENYSTVYDFFESLCYSKVCAHKELLNEIVPRIIRTKTVDYISEFMILYNIIENIRNYCMDTSIEDNRLQIKEEFNFINGKLSTNKHIKNKIKEVVEIVKEEDKEDFLSRVSDKVNFIKKTGLIDQFDSLVNYLRLEISYDLDFKMLIKTRNEIYHGKEPKGDIKQFNFEMIKLINSLIMKLIQN